jgi:hypothetical protein
VRWISAVVLQTNLRGADGAGEGVNGSEGMSTVTKLRGRRECLKGERTPRGGLA